MVMGLPVTLANATARALDSGQPMFAYIAGSCVVCLHVSL